MPATSKSTVTVKQGKPSKPGTVVDTKKAKTVSKPPAPKASAPKKPSADRKTVKGHELTKSWPSKNGREVAKGDSVKLKDGTVGIVLGRFTMGKKTGRIPYVGVRGEGMKKAAHVPSSEVTHTSKKIPVVTAKTAGRGPGTAYAHAANIVSRATAAADAAVSA